VPRTIALLPVALLVAAVLGPAASTAQVPQMMNYQVMLTDNANQPLADQAVVLVFRIYNDASAGALQWTETHNATTNSIGVVSVILGETTPLPTASFTAALWLEVQANGEILLPRRRLVSAPYAIRAGASDVGGVGDGYSLDASDGSPTDAVYVNASGDVGIGTTTPTWDLNLHRASGSSYEHFTTAATGTTTTDGLVVGAESDGESYLWNYENEALVLGTNNQTMMALDAADAVKIGNSYTWSGKLDVYRLGVTTPEIVCATDLSGGNAMFYDETGNASVRVSADDSGTGGLIHVSRNATYNADQGIDLNGNWSGLEEPALRVLGTARSAVFSMGSTGNASVQLPTDAIGSTEMLNEPGVARNQNLSAFSLTGGVDVITSRSITVPAGGYVLALGTCDLLTSHTNGVFSTARIGLSSTTALPSTQLVYSQIAPGAASGTYHNPVTSHELFTVASAGTYTFYYLANETAGDLSVDTAVLSLAYFPTAYGTVPLAGREGDDDAEGRPLTPADIAAEQAEAREFDLARVEGELAGIRAELEAMKAEAGARTPAPAEPASSRPVDQRKATAEGPTLTAN
jgi:hypothetical protein